MKCIQRLRTITHLKDVGNWMWWQPIVSLVTLPPVATSFPNQEHELSHCNVITWPVTTNAHMSHPLTITFQNRKQFKTRLTYYQCNSTFKILATAYDDTEYYGRRMDTISNPALRLLGMRATSKPPAPTCPPPPILRSQSWVPYYISRCAFIKIRFQYFTVYSLQYNLMFYVIIHPQNNISLNSTELSPDSCIVKPNASSRYFVIFVVTRVR
jgi:hypothetical protein